MEAVEAEDAYDSLEHNLADIIDESDSMTEDNYANDEEATDTGKNFRYNDGCITCGTVDEAAITCNACEQNVCSD